MPFEEYKEPSPEQETAYNLDEFDIFSSDPETAKKCLETLFEPDNVFEFSIVFPQLENEGVKRLVAERLDLIGIIEALREESVPDREHQKEHIRGAMQKMIENSEGETKKILKQKLQDFETAMAG